MTTSIPFILFALTRANAFGNNCSGSTGCSDSGAPPNALAIIREKVKNISSSATFVEGQQIAAVNVGVGSCIAAFSQRVSSGSVLQYDTWWYLDALSQHGCSICGSIPTDSGNNVNNGELTVNFVSVCSTQEVGILIPFLAIQLLPILSVALWSYSLVANRTLVIVSAVCKGVEMDKDSQSGMIYLVTL